MVFGAFSSDDDAGSTATASTESPQSTMSPMELLKSHGYSVTGERYHEQFLDGENEDSSEVLSTVKDLSDSDDEEDFVVGPWARRLIETHALTDDEPIWLGWMLDNQEREPIGMKLSFFAKHMWLPGASGGGKSTLFEILQIQMAYRGCGFVTFDPKGKDSRELVAKLPEHRLDDVIFVDPIDPSHDKTIGINFLQINPEIIEEGGQAIEREIASRKKIIKATFEQEGQLHSTMRFLVEVLTEGFLRANVNLIRNGGDPAEQYAFVDYFTLLLNATTRENFAKEVSDPFLRSAVHKVSAMDDDETLPTLKRVVPWVLNHLTRKIIAHRESTIDFQEIIEEDKIVIVRTAIDNEDIQQMLTLGIMRMVWSAVFRRAQNIDGTPDPFFIFADEFQKIASEQLEMGTMFEQARSMNLGVLIAHQFPHQIKSDHEDTYKAMTNNAQTIAAFRSNEEEDAKEVMSRFTEYTYEDLLETDPYEIWTKIALKGDKVSKGLKLNTFAPYPKLRPMEVVDDVIAERLEETGVEPLTTREIVRNMPYEDPYGMMSQVDNDDFSTFEDAQRYKSESIRAEISRAIFHEAIHRGVTTGAEVDPDEEPWWIDVDDALLERADRYAYGAVETESELNSELDEMAGDLIRKRQDDGRQVTITNHARGQLFVQGDGQTTGGGDHGDLGEDATIALVRLGLEADVVEQTGGRDVDGVVRIREQRETGKPKGVSPGAYDRVARQRYERMLEEYPLETWLTDGADCTVEYEKSTAGRKSIINWVKAYNAGERCLFTAREDEAPKVWNAVSEPTAVKSTEEDGAVVNYYNHSQKLRIGGERLVLEDTDSVQWSYDSRDEEFIMADDEGVVRAHFSSHHEIFSNKSKYDGTEEDYDGAEYGKEGPHLTVNVPIIPEREFDVDDREELDHWRDTRVLIVPENVGEDKRPIEEIVRVYTEEGPVALADLDFDSGGGGGGDGGAGDAPSGPTGPSGPSGGEDSGGFDDLLVGDS